MNHIKLFEAYFDESKSWEEVTINQYRDFSNSHQKKSNYKYDGELGIFEDIYDLYERDSDDYDHHQYRIHLNTLEILLVPHKIDIFVRAFEDDWYTIEAAKYHDYEDTDYSKQNYFIVDSLDGINDWIQANLLDDQR